MKDDMLSKIQAIQKLQRQLDEIDPLPRIRRGSPEFTRWHRNTEVAIENIFGRDSRHIKDFTSLEYSLSFCTSETPESRFQAAYGQGLAEAQQVGVCLAGGQKSTVSHDSY